jgi:Chalcone isomerase-like
MYGVTALKDKLASYSKSDPHAVRTLRSDVVSSGEAADSDSGAAVFDLQMSFKVSGEKMASAIAESVVPRFKGPKDEIDQLKSMISSGVGPDGATKGTQFRFECGPNGIAVSVNGQATGSISSKPLAQAFCDVYLDDKCVSPALRTSILENCCAP